MLRFHFTIFLYLNWQSFFLYLKMHHVVRWTHYLLNRKNTKNAFDYLEWKETQKTIFKQIFLTCVCCNMLAWSWKDQSSFVAFLSYPTFVVLNNFMNSVLSSCYQRYFVLKKFLYFKLLLRFSNMIWHFGRKIVF